MAIKKKNNGLSPTAVNKNSNQQTTQFIAIHTGGRRSCGSENAVSCGDIAECISSSTLVQTTIIDTVNTAFLGLGFTNFCAAVTACGGGGGFTCGDVATCIDSNPEVGNSLNNFIDNNATIIAIQGDITNIQTDITNLQTAVSCETIQDCVAPLLVHGNHINITATYNDVGNEIILTGAAGGTFDCSDVANCIDTDIGVQSSLTNFIENNNFTVAGDWTFDGAVNYNAGPITYNNTVTTGTQEFDASYTANYTDSTINNDGTTTTNTDTIEVNNNATVTNNGGVINNIGNVINNTEITENYISTPVQISCETVGTIDTAFATTGIFTGTTPVGTQYATIIINYNNGTVNVTKTIDTLLNGVNQDIFFDGVDVASELLLAWVTGNIELTLANGVNSDFTAVEFCYYNGVSENNYENKIHSHDGDITEHFDTVDVYSTGSVTNNYGEVNLMGNTVIDNLTVNNITVTNPLSILFSDTKFVTGTVMPKVANGMVDSGWTNNANYFSYATATNLTIYKLGTITKKVVSGNIQGISTATLGENQMFGSLILGDVCYYITSNIGNTQRTLWSVNINTDVSILGNHTAVATWAGSNGTLLGYDGTYLIIQEGVLTNVRKRDLLGVDNGIITWAISANIQAVGTNKYLGTDSSEIYLFDNTGAFIGGGSIGNFTFGSDYQIVNGLVYSSQGTTTTFFPYIQI